MDMGHLLRTSIFASYAPMMAFTLLGRRRSFLTSTGLHFALALAGVHIGGPLFAFANNAMAGGCGFLVLDHYLTARRRRQLVRFAVATPLVLAMLVLPFWKTLLPLAANVLA